MGRPDSLILPLMYGARINAPLGANKLWGVLT